MTKLGSKKLHFPKSDQDGVYNWPKNRLKWGGGSERPMAQTQQTLTQVPPSPGEKDDDEDDGGGGGGGNDEESQEPMYLTFAMLSGLWRLRLSAL